VSPAETTDVAATLHQLAEKIRRRGLIVIISDLLDDPDKILWGLKHFRHNQHEVLVFHSLDPFEKTFAYRREAIFKDLETGEEITTQPWHIRGEYVRRMTALTDRYRRECRDSLIDYVPLDTSVPFDRALLAYLSKRGRLG
jgi:hypothetical protein